MAKIFSSASKIVFVLMAIAVTVLTFIKIIDPKDFMMLAAMAFSFYFSAKPTDSNGEITK